MVEFHLSLVGGAGIASEILQAVHHAILIVVTEPWLHAVASLLLLLDDYVQFELKY